VLEVWRSYTDEEAVIFAQTDGEPHNTITPIARMRDGLFELDLTLRNNLTTQEHPLGLYHPHAQYHHIKKVGLIEVMGLAVLPARLSEEMALLADAILEGRDLSADEKLAKHADWVTEFLPSYPSVNAQNIHQILQTEIGHVFVHVLEDAGVFKCTDQGRMYFERFIARL
jgi:UDPglucose--hexose-1-phosphate uridylyltransferase